jgi:ADP-ribose pyrophosphatase YjhB (NUDIX family)
MIGVGAVIFDGAQVLLVRRGREPARGKWSLPGGLVELGETLESAVCREVMEETGLDVRVEGLVAVLDRIIRDDERQIQYHYVLMDFLCHPLRGVPTAGSDVTACGFVPLNKLPAHPLTDGTEKVIRRALAARNLPLPPIYDPAL